MMALKVAPALAITSDQVRYTLAEPLAASDYSQPPPEEREWEDAPAVGCELSTP